MMKALIWKDYRMNRALLVVAAAIVAGPYLIGVLVQFKDAQAVGRWGGTVAASALAAMATSLLVISLMAANAFSQERADRSAEFLAQLPPSRWSILLSKFILALTVSLVMWAVNLMMGLIVAPRLGGFEPPLDDAVASLLPTSVLLFGAGWAASTVMSSPVGAWGVSAAAPMALGGIILSVWYVFDIPADGRIQPIYGAACIVLGVTALIASSIMYVRRVTP